MSEAMVVRTVEASRAFEPSSIEEAYRLAKLLVASRLLPEAVTTPEAAFAVIATGRELGLSAMQSLRSIHVIKGKPTLSADLICALVKGRSDVCKFFRLVSSDETSAVYETARNGEPEPTKMSFSLDDAKRAQLLGSANWQKYPAAMLRARCITALARAVYPDLVMGLYDPDELQQVVEAQVEPPTRPVTVTVTEVANPTLGIVKWADIIRRLDACTSVQEVNKIAVEAKQMHTDGLVDDVQLQQMADSVKAKRATFVRTVAASAEDAAQ